VLLDSARLPMSCCWERAPRPGRGRDGRAVAVTGGQPTAEPPARRVSSTGGCYPSLSQFCLTHNVKTTLASTERPGYVTPGMPGPPGCTSMFSPQTHQAAVPTDLDVPQLQQGALHRHPCVPSNPSHFRFLQGRRNMP